MNSLDPHVQDGMPYFNVKPSTPYLQRLWDACIDFVQLVFDRPLYLWLQKAVRLIYPILMIVAVFCAVLATDRQLPGTLTRIIESPSVFSRHTAKNDHEKDLVKKVQGDKVLLHGSGIKAPPVANMRERQPYMLILAMIICIHLSYWLFLGFDTIYSRTSSKHTLKHLLFLLLLTGGYVTNGYFDLHYASAAIFFTAYAFIGVCEFCELRHDARHRVPQTPGAVLRSRMWIIIDIVIPAAILAQFVLSSWDGFTVGQNYMHILSDYSPLSLKDYIILLNVCAYLFALISSRGALRQSSNIYYRDFLHTLKTTKHNTSGLTNFLKSKGDSLDNSLIIDMACSDGSRSMLLLGEDGLNVQPLGVCGIDIDPCWREPFKRNAEKLMKCNEGYGEIQFCVNDLSEGIRVKERWKEECQSVVLIASHVLHDDVLVKRINRFIAAIIKQFPNKPIYFIGIGCDDNHWLNHSMNEAATKPIPHNYYRWKGLKMVSALGYEYTHMQADTIRKCASIEREMDVTALSIDPFAFWVEASFGYSIGTRTLRVLSRGLESGRIQKLNFGDDVYFWKFTAFGGAMSSSWNSCDVVRNVYRPIQTDVPPTNFAAVLGLFSVLMNKRRSIYDEE